jgi:hypothetical protein
MSLAVFTHNWFHHVNFKLCNVYRNPNGHWEKWRQSDGKCFVSFKFVVEYFTTFFSYISGINLFRCPHVMSHVMSAYRFNFFFSLIWLISIYQQGRVIQRIQTTKNQVDDKYGSYFNYTWSQFYCFSNRYKDPHTWKTNEIKFFFNLIVFFLTNLYFFVIFDKVKKTNSNKFIFVIFLITVNSSWNPSIKVTGIRFGLGRPCMYCTNQSTIWK